MVEVGREGCGEDIGGMKAIITISVNKKINKGR